MSFLGLVSTPCAYAALPGSVDTSLECGGADGAQAQEHGLSCAGREE